MGRYIASAHKPRYPLCPCRVDLYPDSKIHGANMGPIWGRQDPGGPQRWPHEPCYLGTYRYIHYQYLSRVTKLLSLRKIEINSLSLITLSDYVKMLILKKKKSSINDILWNIHSPWYHYQPGKNNALQLVGVNKSSNEYYSNIILSYLNCSCLHWTVTFLYTFVYIVDEYRLQCWNVYWLTWGKPPA